MRLAYCTLLGSNDYFQGVLGLVASLRNTKCQYPLVVMVTDEVDNQYIQYLSSLPKVSIEFVKPIQINQEILKKNAQNNQPKWTNSFTKLNMFGLINYDKLVFIDSDMYVLSNLDYLFTFPNLTAVVAGKSFPGNEDWAELNSGLMVVEPSEDEFKRLVSLIPNKTDQAIGDQDILHRGYPSWKDDHQLHLGEQYNIFFGHIDYYRKHVFTTKTSEKVIHFVGSNKPWNMSKEQFIIYGIKKIIQHRFIELKYIKYYRKLIDDEISNYENWEAGE